MFPSMTKQNMRYRGPMESEKINRFTAAEAYDANKITLKLNDINNKIKTLSGQMMNGDTAAGVLSITGMCQTLDEQHRQIRQLKGALS